MVDLFAFSLYGLLISIGGMAFSPALSLSLSPFHSIFAKNGQEKKSNEWKCYSHSRMLTVELPTGNRL